MLSNIIGIDRIKNEIFKSNFIDPHLRHVLKYCRDKYTHADAKELVPLSEIIQNNIDILEDDGLRYQDRLLPHVVEWFKTSFFKWFEEPACEKCCSNLDRADSYINAEKKRVEVYKCDTEQCDYKYEFVRHNDPAILLHTRRGRCGEWAMCFFIILRSLDYHARIVFDSTDHVWNEVWSELKDRWIHVDSCEGIVDAPLIYEAGWGKKLVYCLAMGQYEVLDVTRRYVLDYNQTKARRDLCNEDWLVEHLSELTKNLIKDIASDDIKHQIQSRRDADLAYLQELARKPQVAPDRSQLQGRKTGSLQWRISRGEYSVSCKSQTTIKVNPTSRSEDTAIFSLTYNCDKDAYHCTDSQYCSKGWSSLVHEFVNVDRKYERDWKTSYLARYESCPPSEVGRICWRFDLSSLNSQWQKIELVICGEMYPNTNIELSLTALANSGDVQPIETHKLELNQPFVLEHLDDGVKLLAITATLSGGDQGDEVAWQKPQLFRQTRSKNAHEWPLSFKIL